MERDALRVNPESPHPINGHPQPLSGATLSNPKAHQSAGDRVHHPQAQRGRHGGVHRVAPLIQHPSADIGAAAVVGRDEAPRRLEAARQVPEVFGGQRGCVDDAALQVGGA